MLCQRYGWDFWTLMDQPEDWIEELGEVICAEAEFQREQERRQGGGTAVPSPPPPPTDPGQTIALARAMGLPLPGEAGRDH